MPSNVTAKIVHSHVELNPSLDLTNELVRPLLFTKSCNLQNQIEFSIVKYFKRAGIGSLNHGITLNRDSRLAKSRLECTRIERISSDVIGVKETSSFM